MFGARRVARRTGRRTARRVSRRQRLSASLTRDAGQRDRLERFDVTAPITLACWWERRSSL